jgi:outer membrane protein assembly factor BamB
MRWLTEGAPGDSFYTSVMVNDGIIYAAAAGRSGGGSLAVKVGGKGDVTESHTKWTSRFGASYASPVVANDAMFLISRGKIQSINAETGEEILSERLPEPEAQPSSSGGRRGRGGMSSDYASPVVADDKLYYVRKSGEMLVFDAKGEFTNLASNRVTTENEEFSSTPAITDGQIFLRSNKTLYCIDSE